MQKINFYLKYAWRSVWRSGRLSLFTILCVALGVATLVALQSLTVSIGDTLVGNVQTRAGGDLITQINSDSDYKLDLLDKAENLLNQLKAKGQISDWTGLNTHNIQIAGFFSIPPTVFVADPQHFPLYGNIPMLEPAGGDFRKLLAEKGSIIVSKTIWDKNNYKLGQIINVSGVVNFTETSDETTPLKVVGEIDPNIPGVVFDTGLFVGFGIISPETANTFLTQADSTPHIVYIKLPPKGNPQTVETALQNFNKQYGYSDFPYFTVTQTAPEVLGQANQLLASVQEILTYIGLVALLIGGLGVINTALVVVSRRTTEIATVKALGLKSRQTLFIFTLEMLLLGAAGSILGIIISIGLGFIIKSVVQSLFMQPLEWGLYPGPILTGFVVGTIASALFGFLPAYAAARVRPTVVLRQQQADSNILPKIGNFTTLLLILLITLLAGGLTGLLVGSLRFGIIFAFIVLVAGLLMVMLMYLVVFLVSKLPGLFGAAFKMALRSLSRHRTRNAATLLVITISLFFISLIGILSDSLKSSLQQAFNYNLGFNAGAVNMFSDRDPQLQKQFQEEVPGVQRVFLINQVNGSLYLINQQRLNPQAALKIPACSKYLHISKDSGPFITHSITVSGRSMTSDGLSISPNGPEKIVAGRTFTAADMDKQVLLISQEIAQCYNIHVGDVLTMGFYYNDFAGTGGVQGNDGIFNATVIGITTHTETATNFEQGFVAPYQLVNQAGANFSIFFMQIDRAHIQQALTIIQKDVYGNLVFNLNDLIDTVVNLLNQILALPLILSLLTLLAGSLLIANNVALAMLERRTEVGVLKALGAKRWRVLIMLWWESSLLGLVGGVLGVGGSILFMLPLPLILKGLSRQYVNLQLAWSPLTALLLILLAVGLAIAATTISAWKAVQERPLVVLRYE